MNRNEINFQGFTFSRPKYRNIRNFNNNNNNNNYTNNNNNSTNDGFFNFNENMVNMRLNNNTKRNSTKRNSTNRNSTKKRKSVTWKNNNKLHIMNKNKNNDYLNALRNARKSIKTKGFPDDFDLTEEEFDIINEMLNKKSDLTLEERRKLRKNIITYLKEKSEKYGLVHLEPYEKEFLEFEAMRG